MSEAAARIPLARPAIGPRERVAVDRVLASGRLVMGPENHRFEVGLASRTGRAHAIAVSSGTSALELALWALGVAPGDDVLVTGFGFVAAANAVARLGARPVPVDVDPGSWNLDLAAARTALTPQTRGIISIDQLGLVADAAALEQLAADAGIWLLDDAACGLGGCDAAGRPGGSAGRLATLSFHPRKVITTGEGGAIVTDDAELAARLRALRNHGQSGAPPAVVGTNARLGEIAAAIGCVQLVRLDAMLSERRLLADGYRQRLAHLVDDEQLSWQELAEGAMHSYQSFAVRLAAGVDRDAVRRALDDRGIEAGVATYAFHRLPAFASGAELPVADGLHDRGLSLPLFVGMRSAELDRVAEALGEALR